MIILFLTFGMPFIFHLLCVMAQHVIIHKYLYSVNTCGFHFEVTSFGFHPSWQDKDRIAFKQCGDAAPDVYGNNLIRGRETLPKETPP